jgi:hypothetical protein
VRPGVVGKPAVGADRVGLEALVPQRHGLLHVVLLQGLQLGGVKGDLRGGGAGRQAKIQRLERLQGIAPAVAKELLELLGRSGPLSVRIHVVSRDPVHSGLPEYSRFHVALQQLFRRLQWFTSW